jgi:ribosomal protein S15P/S13E|tara:strand:+ start:55 stop:408 length:354 start_codon:yes stop_codon:yes gene_type:complete
MEKISEKTQVKKKSTTKKISQTEFEKKIIELSKKNLTAEKIGESLRKQNIHPKGYNKKISKILKEKNIYVNPDLVNIGKKLEGLKIHYEKNKQDKRAKREVVRISAKIRKLKKYFKI